MKWYCRNVEHHAVLDSDADTKVVDSYCRLLTTRFWLKLRASPVLLLLCCHT